jgi:hypothetical protein
MNPSSELDRSAISLLYDHRMVLGRPVACWHKGTRVLTWAAGHLLRLRADQMHLSASHAAGGLVPFKWQLLHMITSCLFHVEALWH